jgi:hypothetical protein
MIVQFEMDEVDHLDDDRLQQVVDVAREYVEDEVKYENLRYLLRLERLCNTPNLFAPIV